MATYLFDKLAILKENEAKNKEEQKIILEEMEFEIEKQRRLEMDGTIIKLRTQVDEFAENIGGEIMPNNIRLVDLSMTSKFNNDWHVLSVCRGKITDEEYKKRSDVLSKRGLELDELKKKNTIRFPRGDEKKITLDEFTANINNIDERTKETFLRKNKGLIEPSPEIKIYADLKPIFATMIGVMNKQQDEIQKLRELMTLKI